MDTDPGEPLELWSSDGCFGRRLIAPSIILQSKLSYYHACTMVRASHCLLVSSCDIASALVKEGLPSVEIQSKESTKFPLSASLISIIYTANRINYQLFPGCNNLECCISGVLCG